MGCVFLDTNLSVPVKLVLAGLHRSSGISVRVQLIVEPKVCPMAFWFTSKSTWSIL